MRRPGTITALGVGALLCAALATPSASATVGGPATAAAPTTTLDLELDEPAGSVLAHDSSGSGHDGAIGRHIRMNGSYADWDRHSPSEGVFYGADHLLVVADAADASLDPGTGGFSVEFRYRSTDRFGNVLQKGQARTTGGQVKFQQPRGYLSCMFKSPAGTASTKSTIPLNDGQWHVIRCDRTPTEVTLYVDGVFNNRIRHTTGAIDNKSPWTIGGKLDCDTSDPTVGADSCDYFPGDIDSVRLTKG